MPATRIDDVTHVHASIEEIIRLAYIELPTSAKFGLGALTCDDRAGAVQMLRRMHSRAAEAKCEYLAELIDFTLQQLDDMTDDWVGAPW